MAIEKRRVLYTRENGEPVYSSLDSTGRYRTVDNLNQDWLDAYEHDRDSPLYEVLPYEPITIHVAGVEEGGCGLMCMAIGGYYYAASYPHRPRYRRLMHDETATPPLPTLTHFHPLVVQQFTTLPPIMKLPRRLR